MKACVINSVMRRSRAMAAMSWKPWDFEFVGVVAARMTNRIRRGSPRFWESEVWRGLLV